MAASDPKADEHFDRMRGDAPAGQGETGCFAADDGCKLFTETWLPKAAPKKMLLCFHGMGGHGRYYAMIADVLVPLGIGVVAMDYRGHGLSEGERGDIPAPARLVADGKQFIAHIKDKFPGVPMFTLGESMGGAVSPNVVMTNPGVSGMVLFAPAVGLAYKFPLKDILMAPFYLLLLLFAPGAKLIYTGGHEHEGMNCEKNIEYDRNDRFHLTHVCIRYLRNLKWLIDNAAKNAARSISVPTLIFQGGRDNGIDPRAVRRFFDALPAADKSFVFFDEAKHCMVTDPVFGPQLKSQLAEWLAAH